MSNESNIAGDAPGQEDSTDFEPRKYYETLKQLHEEGVGRINELETVLVAGNSAWYKQSLADIDSAGADDGFYYVSEPVTPDNYYPSSERSLYQLNTYADSDSFKTVYFSKNEGREWRSDKSERLPDYSQIEAFSLLVDIDLESEYKDRPLPDEHAEVVEKRMKNWQRAFARMLLGDDWSEERAKEVVHTLDSGGGVYVLTPPTALRRIAQRFEGDERAWVFKEISRRMRRFTEVLDEKIAAEDDAPDELFMADAVTHKNRQFKTVGSVHKSLDAVVHPLSFGGEYEHVRRADVDESMRTEFTEWAESFTNSYDNLVPNIVEYLFQSPPVQKGEVDVDPVEGVSWTDILDTFIEKKREQIQKRQESVAKRARSPDDSVAATSVTTEYADVQRALRRIDVRPYAKQIADEWATQRSSDTQVAFDPAWRPSESGTGAFFDADQNVFTDRSTMNSGGAVSAAAFLMGNIDDPTAENPRGAEFFEALDWLREQGEKIPLLIIPLEERDEYDQLLYNEIAKSGLALDVLDESDVSREVEDGRESLVIDNDKKFNETLSALEGAGILHGHEYKTPPGFEGDVPGQGGDGNSWADEHLVTLSELEGSIVRLVTQARSKPYEALDKGFQYPVYQLPDSELELHFVPHDKQGGVLAVVNTDGVYRGDIKAVDLTEDFNSVYQQQQRAAQLAKDVHPGRTRLQESLKPKIRSALSDFSTDVEVEEELEEFIQPSAIRFLIEQIEEVRQIHVEGEDVFFEIDFEDDPRSDARRSPTIELDMDTVQFKKLKLIVSKYASAAGETLQELDVGEDNISAGYLTSYISDQKEYRYIENPLWPVVADEMIRRANRTNLKDLSRVESWNGKQEQAVWVPGYEFGDEPDIPDDAKPIVFSGQYIRELRDEFTNENVSVSDALFETDILLKEPHKARAPLRTALKEVNHPNARPQVWVMDADKLGIDVQKQLVDGEDEHDDVTPPEEESKAFGGGTA